MNLKNIQYNEMDRQYTYIEINNYCTNIKFPILYSLVSSHAF